MLGNATLNSELEKLRSKQNENVRDYEREIRQRETSIAGLERAVEELSTQLTDAHNKVEYSMAFSPTPSITNTHDKAEEEFISV